MTPPTAVVRRPHRTALARLLAVLALAAGLLVTFGGTQSARAADCGVLSSGAAAQAQSAVGQACGLLGTPYSWGGGHSATPGPTYGICDPSNGAPNDCNVDGLDCSGMVRYAYYLAVGSDVIPGTSAGQYQSSAAVARFSASQGTAPLLPGDLLFFGGSAASIHHVALYLGQGQIVEAPYSGGHVQVASVSSHSDYYGAIRLYGSGGGTGPGLYYVDTFANAPVYASPRTPRRPARSTPGRTTSTARCGAVRSSTAAPTTTTGCSPTPTPVPAASTSPRSTCRAGATTRPRTTTAPSSPTADHHRTAPSPPMNEETPVSMSGLRTLRPSSGGRWGIAAGLAAVLSAAFFSAPAMADPAPVPCSASGGVYYCDFYPAGDGYSAGCPRPELRRRRGRLSQPGFNFVFCQEVGGEDTSGGYSNDWWAWTEANNGSYGWVSALWGRAETTTDASRAYPTAAALRLAARWRWSGGQTCSSTPGPGTAVTRWNNIVVCVLGMLGQPASSGLINDVDIVIAANRAATPTRSTTGTSTRGGHPSIGLVQVIQPTFDTWHSSQLPNNIWDPASNIYAGMNYGIHTYGSIQQIPGVASVNAGGPYKPYVAPRD